MKTRIRSVLTQPSAAGFTLGDVTVILAILSLVVAILYPVFAHA